MGRPRKTAQGNALPKYVYLKKGRYIYEQRRSGRCVEIFLCKYGASIRTIWERFEAVAEGSTQNTTLSNLFNEWFMAKKLKEYSRSTLTDYRGCAKSISNYKMANGKLFGTIDYRRIQRQDIVKYRDARGSSSKRRANKELAFMSTVFHWALERGLIVGDNPAFRVTKFPTEKRRVYISDKDLSIYLQVATEFDKRCKKGGYMYKAILFAYLMRLRKSEVLDLRVKDATKHGVLARRLKGSKHQIIGWTPDLRRLVGVPMSPPESYLLGRKISHAAIDTAWRSISEEARNRGAIRCWFHDLKKKGVSDFKGDVRDAAGHRSITIAEDYKLTVSIIGATK